MSASTISIAAVIVSLVTAVASFYNAWSSRAASNRSNDRSDFQVIADALKGQVNDLRAEVEAERRVRKVLTAYVRTLVRQMRDADLDPLPAPDEINL